MSKLSETDLYAPTKLWLESLGYSVKGEVGAADVVARKDGELLIVELKLGFSLVLLQQAVARQAVSDAVYVAVPRWRGKAGWRAFKGNIGLCRRLGLGVLSVQLADGSVQEHAAPGPFHPRKSPARRAQMLREFETRAGDPTKGGTRGQVMTAYRQAALACVAYLAEAGTAKGADVARATEFRHATRLMADNHHGWFCRVERGTYTLSAAGLTQARAAEFAARSPASPDEPQ